MAESGSPRFVKSLEGVPIDLRARMQAGRFETLTDADWTEAERWIQRHRAGFLESLLPLRPAWFSGELMIAAVADLRVVRYMPHPPPSGRLVDFAESERGAGTGKPEFDRSRMVGMPIAVGPALDGPLMLVEGYTRCCQALRDQKVGLFDGLPMPLIVGVTRQIPGWVWWW